jgi:hydrogenase-4 component F
MLLFAVLVPPLIGALAFAYPGNVRRPLFLVVGALAHAAALVSFWVREPAPALDGLLALDPLGKVMLSTTSALFLACAVYAQGYLRRRDERDNRVFVSGLLVLLGAMTAVALAQHFGLLWVAIELTTLASAPLIYFNHNARSLEAAWKYLLICSVGIGLALLGTFLLALSGSGPDGPRSLFLPDLLAAGPSLSKPWVRAAFVFLLVGYGTKMGLAPLHTWKPDAYGEAPGLLGALLSGGLTNFAFLSIARTFQVCRAAGEDLFARQTLIGLGLVSMAVAAVFMIGQRDLKRMLAYSSVEQMGVLVLGIGLGGVAAKGAMFQSMNNGLVKGVLFLAVGNIHRTFGSRLSGEVHGAMRRLPISGALFLAGFLAITGSPPFSPFYSELAIASGALSSGHWWVAGLYLLFLLVIFVAMGATVLAVVQGDPEGTVEVPGTRDSLLTAAPPLVLLLVVLALGLYLPASLDDLFARAATLVSGS